MTLRLLIVTDAWCPQVNGVVRTLATIGEELAAQGDEVRKPLPDGSRHSNQQLSISQRKDRLAFGHDGT